MSPKINNNLDLITGRTDIRKRPNKIKYRFKKRK